MATESEENPEVSFNWGEYLDAVIKHLWIVVLAVIIGGVVATVLVSKQVVTYEARAVLMISDDQNRVLDSVKPVVDGQFENADMINTMIDSLLSYSFAQRIVERLHLNTDRDFLRSAGIEDKSLSVERAARVLNAMVKAQYRQGTKLLDIFVTTREARQSQFLANSYAKEYLTYIKDQRMDATQLVNKSLVDEAARLREKMRLSDAKMQSFREKERTPSLDAKLEEAQVKLNEASERVSKLEEQSLQIKRDLAAARVSVDSPQDLLRLPSVANEPRVAALTQSISEQERDLGLLSQRYRPKHPAYIAAKTNLEYSLQERENILKSVVGILDVSAKQTDAQIAQMKEARAGYEDALLQITSKSIDYNTLKREIDSDSAMYASVLERLKEVDTTENIGSIPVQIHQLAEDSTVRSSSAIKTIGMGLVGGLLAGMGIAIGLHMLDQSVKSVDEAEKVSGLPVVSTVPLIKGKTDLIAFNVRRGQAAEAFRTLRASQTVSHADSALRRIFLFTSSIPNEGKTFASSNFAVTLAQQNLRTLLIDADLRKPTLARLFSTKDTEAGLAEVLAGTAPLESVARVTEVPNLTLLTAGRLVENPSELLSTSAFRELLAKAMKDYDRVVIDSAPCIAVSDTFLVLPYVDACCLVVRAFSTPKAILKRAIKALSESKYPKANVILNGLPGRQLAYPGYY
jgi:capsular exopolysaccharide synthesis family protein